MKTLLSILGSVTLTATGAATSLTSLSSLGTQENNIVDVNLNQNNMLIENFEKEFLVTNEKTVQKIILSSLESNNGKIEINSNNFSILKNKDLVNLLKSEEFLILIQDLYSSKIIILNDSNEFIFANRNQLFTDGLWIETHWYWFGYCKVHFTHALTNTLLDILFLCNGDVIQLSPRLIYFFPELTTLAPVWTIDLAFVHQYDYIKKLDHGNGIAFDSMGLTTLIHYWSN